MNVALGTNVLVSGILSPNGPPAAILRAVLTERVTLCFDERILSEYRDVLTRGKFGFEPALIDELLDFIEATGVPGLAEPLDLHLPDPTDGMFIEVCLAAGANYLITGNARHFPARERRGLNVQSPRAFLAYLRG